MGFLNQLGQSLRSFWQAAGNGWLNLLNGASNFMNNDFGNSMGSLVNSVTGAGPTGADLQAQEYQTSEREAAQAWTAQREDTRYQRTVADMQAAGINPMMASGMNPTSSPSSGQSAPASRVGSLSDVMQLMMLEKQMGVMDAQRKNLEASAGEKTSRTTVNETRVEEIKQAICESQQRIDKMIAEEHKIWSEADLNEVKELELYSNIDLNQCTVENMTALRQSAIELNEAKSIEARSQSALNFWNTMYQKGLINAGMCEKVAAKVAAETRLADSNGHLMDENATKVAIENSIKSGKWSTEMSQEGTAWDKVVMHLDRATSIVGNVLSLSN